MMKWTLVCYKEIETPAAPYVSIHVVGIVENVKGERVIARITPRGRIHIGISGELMQNQRTGQNVFLPE